MKKLKKQWNKVTVLLLTFGIVFGLFGAMPVQAQDSPLNPIALLILSLLKRAAS